MNEDWGAMSLEQSTRSSRPPTASASDVKTNKTDGGSGVVSKLPARIIKKRDNGGIQWSGPGQAPPSALQSKPKNPSGRQKTSQARGGRGVQRKNDQQVTDWTDPDLDQFLPSAGSKQNLAHLLNAKFQLAPRESTTPYWRATHSEGSGRRHHGHYSTRGHFNKDSYLQANCQFVVKADGDYSVYLADPDLLVQWESIEQIRVWGSEVGSCPICLHPPVAARMTRCGHIYCWPCVLHFLALSDRPWRPCPICDDPVRLGDLKSVVALEHRQLRLGQVLEMRLMRRERHSLQPQPVTSTENVGIMKGSLAYLQKAGSHHVYSKLLLATPTDVVESILQWEKRDLQRQWEEEKDCPEACFIQQALELLADRERNLICDASPETKPRLTIADKEEPVEALVEAVTNLDVASSDGCRSRYESVSSDGTVPQQPNQCLLDDLDVCATSPPVRSGNASAHQKTWFYFYQSSDGQAAYLHPLNIQMLVRQYGALELCPHVIEGRIIENETLSMTEELRHRMRYLSHMPISSQFQSVELALDEPLVDVDVLQEFTERIDERERRRRRKDREQRRRDTEIQRVEEAKWGRTKSQPIAHQLDSQLHFPGFDSSPTGAPIHVGGYSGDNPPLPTLASDPPILAGSPPHDDHGGPSFAQMLRQGQGRKQPMWPTMTSASAPRRRLDSDPPNADGLDYAPAPEFRQTFSSALAAAFDKAAALSTDGADGGQNTAPTTGKGKRKAKHKVLFATGMKFM